MDDYVFQASGDACAICLALDGTNCSTLPHENCLCQIVPKGDECDHSGTEINLVHYGSGSRDFRVTGEFVVVCPDGSEIGESREFDAGALPPVMDAQGLDWAVERELDEIWAELCEQCQEPEFLCC